MIHGKIDEEGKLLFPIELVAFDGDVLPVDALLDTGFTQWIAMNTQDAESLGWTFLEKNRPMLTARGATNFKVCWETVIFDGQEFTIPILAGNAISEILLGLPKRERERERERGRSTKRERDWIGEKKKY